MKRNYIKLFKLITDMTGMDMCHKSHMVQLTLTWAYKSSDLIFQKHERYDKITNEQSVTVEWNDRYVL